MARFEVLTNKGWDILENYKSITVKGQTIEGLYCWLVRFVPLNSFQRLYRVPYQPLGRLA
jgi:hypothetical protein